MRRNMVLPIFQQNSETYVISMNDQDYVDCQVSSCPGTYYKKHTVRQHFNFRHWHHTIIIAEEGQLPQCPRWELPDSAYLKVYAVYPATNKLYT
jgi:hypothetical protein